MIRNRTYLAAFIGIAVLLTVLALVVLPSGRFSWVTLADAYSTGSTAPSKPGVVQEGGNAIIQTKADGSLNLISLGAYGVSTVVLDISSSALADLPAHPANNTKIGATSDNYITVYKLTTGELQANIGPDSEGKIFVYVFTVNPQNCVSTYEMSASDPTPRFQHSC